MCTHYDAVKVLERFYRKFGVAPPPETGKLDMWPGYVGTLRPRCIGSPVKHEV